MSGECDIHVFILFCLQTFSLTLNMFTKKKYITCVMYFFCKLQKFNHALNVKNTLKYFQKLFNLVILKLQLVDS